MLISQSKLLQQQTDSVLIQIQGSHRDLNRDLNALDGAGFQWSPPERKKDPKVLFSIACRIQWHSANAIFGAGNETRTRDPDLGKVVLYQLSYSRVLVMRIL